MQWWDCLCPAAAGQAELQGSASGNSGGPLPAAAADGEMPATGLSPPGRNFEIGPSFEAAIASLTSKRDRNSPVQASQDFLSQTVKMRRISRLQRPSVAITQCLQASSASAPQHAAVCRAAAAATATVRGPREFSTTPQRTFHGSRTREDKPKAEPAEETAREADQASTEIEARQAAEDFLDPYDPEAEPLRVDTALALPPDEVTLAPRADSVEEIEMDYTPAEHAGGLEVVGGLKGWFERDDHWGGTKRYAGFVPTHKVQDRALLELSVRRAVVEALAVTSQNDAELLTGLWERGEKEDAVRVLGLGIQVAEDGSAKLVGDVEGAVKGLRWDPEAPGSSASLDEEVGKQRFTAEEASEIVQTWDKTWKAISLQDVRLKFAVCTTVSTYPILPLAILNPNYGR